MDIKGIPCNTESGEPFYEEQLRSIDFTKPDYIRWIKDLQESALHWCLRAKQAESANEIADGGEY